MSRIERKGKEMKGFREARTIILVHEILVLSNGLESELNSKGRREIHISTLFSDKVKVKFRLVPVEEAVVAERLDADFHPLQTRVVLALLRQKLDIRKRRQINKMSWGINSKRRMSGK